MIDPGNLPRWRGFNLLSLFSEQGSSDRSDGAFPEEDLQWIAEWGFDFVRIPMDYRLWVEWPNPLAIREQALAPVDRAVELGEKHGLHVSLNIHNAPGYCINPRPDEPFDLWRDQDALDAFSLHWATFAKRYRGIPSDRLSFNLLNEPKVPEEAGGDATYERVVRQVVASIRDHDADRLIIADGTEVGRKPLPQLGDLGIAQGCRAYAPGGISHYRAGWVPNSDTWPIPTWPQRKNHPQGGWDRTRLEEHYAPWGELAQSGIGVHCGEGGAYQYTSHEVVLAWFEDVLEILTGYGIGYALWNFRGPFGILDSNRADVDYEDWHGHKLDRRFLELLQRY